MWIWNTMIICQNCWPLPGIKTANVNIWKSLTQVLNNIAFTRTVSRMLEGHLIVKSQKGLNFLQIYHIPSCDSHIDLFTLGLVGKGRINLLPFSLLVYLSRHAFIIAVNFYGDHHQNHTVLQFNEKQEKDLFITVHFWKEIEIRFIEFSLWF